MNASVYAELNRLILQLININRPKNPFNFYEEFRHLHDHVASTVVQGLGVVQTLVLT